MKVAVGDVGTYDAESKVTRCHECGVVKKCVVWKDAEGVAAYCQEPCWPKDCVILPTNSQANRK